MNARKTVLLPRELSFKNLAKKERTVRRQCTPPSTPAPPQFCPSKAPAISLSTSIAGYVRLRRWRNRRRPGKGRTKKTNGSERSNVLIRLLYIPPEPFLVIYILPQGGAHPPIIFMNLKLSTMYLNTGKWRSTSVIAGQGHEGELLRPGGRGRTGGGNRLSSLHRNRNPEKWINWPC